jgi:transcriptional regulator with XRE-family HTH domain
MKKRAPNLRLKTVRKIVDDTQKEFARRIGVSYPYVLSVETGQRGMSRSLAELVLRATGVSPEWLLDESASPNSPISIFGKPYTAEVAKELMEKGRNPAVPVDPLGDESGQIDDLCQFLAELLRAAVRKGRYGVCRYYAQRLIAETRSNLGLENLADEESHYNVPDWLFGEDFESGGEMTPSQMFQAWQMLSPAGRVRWSDAMIDERDRELLLDDIDQMRIAVETSFTAKRRPRPSRPPQQKA